MKNLTPEMIAKAKTAKSAEELLELAKENGIALTAEDANTYFAQLHANDVVADDELDAVAGGCGTEGEKTTKQNYFAECLFCKARIPARTYKKGKKCPACQKIISFDFPGC